MLDWKCHRFLFHQTGKIHSRLLNDSNPTGRIEAKRPIWTQERFMRVLFRRQISNCTNSTSWTSPNPNASGNNSALDIRFSPYVITFLRCFSSAWRYLENSTITGSSSSTGLVSIETDSANHSIPTSIESECHSGVDDVSIRSIWLGNDKIYPRWRWTFPFARSPSRDVEYSLESQRCDAFNPDHRLSGRERATFDKRCRHELLIRTIWIHWVAFVCVLKVVSSPKRNVVEQCTLARRPVPEIYFYSNVTFCYARRKTKATANRFNINSKNWLK